MSKSEFPFFKDVILYLSSNWLNGYWEEDEQVKSLQTEDKQKINLSNTKNCDPIPLTINDKVIVTWNCALTLAACFLEVILLHIVRLAMAFRVFMSLSIYNKWCQLKITMCNNIDRTLFSHVRILFNYVARERAYRWRPRLWSEWLVLSTKKTNDLEWKKMYLNHNSENNSDTWFSERLWWKYSNKLSSQNSVTKCLNIS